MPAVLLPSASILRKYYGEPLQWKVRLSHPPKHRLEYLFLRSSTNVEDIEPRLNVEETFIDSPPKCSFEKYITVELVVSEDGTTHPKFIYKKGRSEQDRIMVEGRPFMLDITDGTKAHGKINAYVGLDFGTSNTAVSFIDSTTIEVFEERSKDDRYLDLYSLVDVLPFPLALPLRRFLSEVDPEKQVKRGLEFIEHAMSLGAYLVHAEYRTGKTRKTKFFKNLSQRSVGPLWSFMQDCLNGIKEDTALSTPLKSLLAGDVYSEVDALVARLVGFKHEKVKVENVKPMKGIRQMANIFNHVFAKAVFGFFEDVQQLPFVSRYAGRFRVAHGAPPFIRHYEFQGPNSFSSNEAFVVRLDEQIAIPLFPLIFWSRCAKHSDLEHPHCYIYDKTSRSGTHTFVAVGITCPVNPAENQTFAPLVKTIDTLNNSDAPSSKFDDVLLTRREAVD